MVYDIPTIYPTILESGGHTLIAGTTGSGKSVMLNGIITTALIQGDKHLFLIDPKKVEFCEYRGIGAVKGYADTSAQALELLGLVERYMDSRYSEMQMQGRKQSDRAKILVVIDELADLLISEQGRAIKTKIQRLAQLGRAARITIIVATQCPNRRIIPAEIVLNFTQRIGLRCLTAIESRQIINVKGCESLEMYGRCLFLRPAHEIECWYCPMLEQGIADQVLANWRKVS